MGLKSWIARKGAVGGTARWAANGYKFFRQQHPDNAEFSDATLFRLMIVARFQVLPDQTAQNYLLSKCDEFQGLIGLVIEILKVEAALHENDGENIRIFVEVIEDELRKAGISEAARFGEFSRVGDYGHQACQEPGP